MHPNERKLRLCISLALEGQPWFQSLRVLHPRSNFKSPVRLAARTLCGKCVKVRLTPSSEDTTSKCFGRPLLTSANPSVPVHLPSAQKEAWKTMLPQRFHQDIQVMEKRYQRRWDEAMMGDYIWSLVREDSTTYKRKNLSNVHFWSPVKNDYFIHLWKM